MWQIGSSKDWMLSRVYEERPWQNRDNFRQFREGHSLRWDWGEEIEQKVLSGKHSQASKEASFIIFLATEFASFVQGGFF